MRIRHLGRTMRLLSALGLGIALLVLLTGCGQGKSEKGSGPSGDADDSRSWAGDLDGKRTDKPAAPPTVVLETSLGEITVELDQKNSPQTVDNFIQYVDANHYAGVIFHRVDKGYAALGGVYTPGLDERPPTRASIRNEAANGLKNLQGTIAMARQPDGIDSATSQFFFNLGDNPQLDHRDDTPGGYGYCVFGRVISGLDVLDRIGDVPVRDAVGVGGEPMQRVPVEPILIKRIRRVR